MKTKYAISYYWLNSLTGRYAKHLKEKYNISKNGIIKQLDQGPNILISIINRTLEEQTAINS